MTTDKLAEIREKYAPGAVIKYGNNHTEVIGSLTVDILYLLSRLEEQADQWKEGEVHLTSHLEEIDRLTAQIARLEEGLELIGELGSDTSMSTVYKIVDALLKGEKR